MAYNIEFYQENEAEEWDAFIYKSMNGTFLQTRKFINYHPIGKFKDCSLCVRKGKELAAVVLACEANSNGEKVFYAHRGTTFGGISIDHSIYSASAINEIVELIIKFIRDNDYKRIYLKMVPDIYQKKNTDLLDYFLYKNDFKCYDELNYYLSLEKYKDEITKPFTASKRRDYRYSLKSGLVFKRLENRNEISDYYAILLMNLHKLNLQPVHTLEDLYNLKYDRFPDNVDFFGVYKDDKIVAGSMLFYFNADIVHTQYLSSDEEYLKLYPMDFLIANLIQVAVDKNMRIFTFGICTEDQGHYLNYGLSRFKEGFGSEFCINRSYEKKLVD